MNRATMWWFAYVSVVSMKAHPRNEVPPDLDGCAGLVDEMMERFCERWAVVKEPVQPDLWRS